MQDQLYIDEQGRFQMASDTLKAFIAFLRDNHVPCSELEPDAFASEGRHYGYGQLHHPYEVDLAEELYRDWTSCQLQSVGLIPNR